MKRLLLFFTLMLCCMGAAYGQVLTASPNVIPPGYNGALTFSGTGYNFTRSTMGFTLRLTHNSSGQQYNFGPNPMWFMPNFPYPPITSISGNVVLPANAPTGTYDVLLEGYGLFGANNYITSSNLITVSPSLNYSHFMGKMIRDVDSNCVQNGPDAGLGGRLITITPGPYYAMTDNNGEFDALLPPGTYTFSGPQVPSATMVCPVGGSRSATMNTPLGTVSGIDFYYKVKTHTDIQSQLFVNPHRPGFSINVTNRVSNVSFQDASNVVAMLVKPSFMAFDSFHVAPSNVNGDTAWFQWPSIVAGGHKNFTVRLLTPMTPIGTPFTYWANCSTGSTELILSNNPTSFTDFVSGSYDPNDIRVWTKTGENADGFIQPTDTLLRYMIRFQNTGNDTAFNIRVRDTLDVDLETGSMQIIGASHNYQLLLGDSTGRAIEFFFPNILLADSFRNEPMSHGFIEYSICRKNGLAVGTSIDNVASIYFDFNAPIVTNTTHSVICPKLDSTFGMNAAGLAVSFNASTANLANGWTWDFGDGNTGTGANASHTYGALGTYTVTLIQTSSCGRSDTLVRPVTVSCAALNANYTSVSASGSHSVSFSNISTGTGMQYSWNFGDGNTSTSASPTHVYANAGTYTVCLTTTDVCGNTDVQCYSVVVNCSVIGANHGNSVNNNTVNFTDLSVGDVVAWSWDFGDGNTATTAFPSHTYSSTGTYTVCLTVTDFCGSTASHCNTVTITCVEPVSMWAFQNNQLTVDFTDLSTDATGWNWDFGDGFSSAQQNPSHTYSAPGVYQVCLTTLNACAQHTQCYSVTVIGVGTVDPAEALVLVSPNPTDGRLNVSIQNLLAPRVDFVLYDVTGRKLEVWTGELAGGAYSRTWELPVKESGTYFLRVQTEEGSRTVPVVVQ